MLINIPFKLGLVEKIIKFGENIKLKKIPELRLFHRSLQVLTPLFKNLDREVLKGTRCIRGVIYARIELSHGPRGLAGERAKTPSVSGGRLTCLLREMTTDADHSGQQRFHCR